MAGARGEGNAGARANPRQIDLRSFVHRHGGTARIPEDNLPAFHIRRDFHVVSGRKEAARMTMQYIVIARLVHVDPALQTEPVLLLPLRWTEVIEESLNVLL